MQKFALRDSERTIGILYLDPFPRAGKKVQSAQFTLQGSKVSQLTAGELWLLGHSTGTNNYQYHGPL